MASTKSDTSEKNKVHDLKDMVCGYVMPISDASEYRVGHWEDVKSMLDEVTLAIGFKESRIVSTGLDVSTIHKRIVNNIYNDDIIICDVSSRNPNVMFELGMRIAFDKPVVIIKDNATQYCFDSGTIEHIEYPKDMRYSEIEKFKQHLKQKIEKTIESHKKNPDESPILHSFGSFSVAKPNIPEMSESDELRSELQEIKAMLFRSLQEKDRTIRVMRNNEAINSEDMVIRERIPKAPFGNSDDEVASKISSFSGIIIENMDEDSVYIRARSPSHFRQLIKSM